MKRLLILVFFLIVLYSYLSAQNLADSLSYKIHKGDKLSVYVMDHSEFSYDNLVVMPDGYIQYPGIGSFQVAGVSLDAFRDSIDLVVSQFVPNPMITVNVASIYNNNINVLGYVNRQGSYQIFEPVDILYALSLAGGIKDSGNSKIKLYRSDGTLEITRMKTILNSRNAKLKEPKVLVYPYDTVVIEPPNRVNLPVISTVLTTVLLIANLYNLFK